MIASYLLLCCSAGIRICISTYKSIAGQLKTQIGTPYYMSPEIWNNRPYDFSSDIWSLGCMIYELCALKPPFTGTDFPSLKRAVTAGRYSHIPKKYSESLSRVISMMLRLNPKERPTADQLLRHHEMASKLQLDEGKIAGVSFCDAEAQRKQLLQTIMVPQNLRQLNKALPKPAYPDSVQSGRGQGPSDPLPAPPVPPPPAANSRTPLAPLPENLKDARNALAADGTADSKAHHHKERARADVYKDYQPQAPPGRGREAPTAPSGANTNASAPVAPSVPYSARPGRLNMQQYEAAVRKQQQAVAQQAQNQYSQYSNNSGVERAGFQRKQSHHRIW